MYIGRVCCASVHVSNQGGKRFEARNSIAVSDNERVVFLACENLLRQDRYQREGFSRGRI